MADRRSTHPGHARRAGAAAAFVLAVLALAACTYGGRVDDPVSRKLTWFSYLDGDDVRGRCGTGGAGEWEIRLTRNGNYHSQVRSYHLVADGAGGAYLTARATPSDYGNLARLSLNDPFDAWRFAISRTRLDAPAREALEAKLRKSGLYGPTPVGLRLPSWGWYWTAIVCRDGELHYNAWLYPSERWERQDFRAAFAPYDDTGVPYTEPKKAVHARSEMIQRNREGFNASKFTLEVGETGLRGTSPLF